MSKDPEVFSVSARNDLGKKINLEDVVREITEAKFNEGFKGGRVELKIYFGSKKIGSIELYSSGKFLIRGRSEEDVLLASDKFIQMLRLL